MNRAASVLTGFVLILSAGCASPLERSVPLNNAALIPTTREVTYGFSGRASWMLPEAKSDDLIYAYTENDIVVVLSYPQGKEVGQLSGFSGVSGACVDTAGDVWIVNFSPPEVIEYAHGGTTPIATLSDPGAEPVGCSVDASTGNLAIVSYYPSNVAVYQKAQGNPTLYTDPDFTEYGACAYDGSGNLFVDGAITVGEIAELPRGSNAMQTVSLSEQIFPRDLEWDGHYLAIVDNTGAPRGPIPVDRVNITPSGGQVVGTTQLQSPGGHRPGDGVQYAIRGKTIVGPDRYEKRHEFSLLFWRYPKGGKPTRVIRNIGAPNGAVISSAAGKTR